MKYCFLIITCLFTMLSLAQTDLEVALNNAEKDLFQLEEKKTQLARELKDRGEIPKLNTQYMQAHNAYKIQLKKTKELRKQYKREQKERRRNQSATVTQPQVPRKPVISRSPTPSFPQSADQTNARLIKQAKKERKKEIRAIKKEIKQLKKAQKVLIRQAEAVGQAPMKQPEIQRYDRKIMQKQVEMNQLKSKPISIASSPQPLNNQRQPVEQPRPTPQPVVKKPSTQQPLPKYNAEPPVTQENDTVAPAVELPEIGLSTILFPKFSTEVPENYKLYLNHVAKQMQTNPALILQIDSYTDNSEKKRVSMQITAGMANAVAQEMVNRGIPPSRLSVKANGSKNPVGDNNTFFGQARNRRVELDFTY